MQDITYHPIGVVENAFSEGDGNPKKIRNSQSILHIDEKFIPAMRGLENFKYLIVLFHLDRSAGFVEEVHPMGDQSLPKRGVLATRSPCRPNPLGITVVEVLEIKGGEILVTGLDAIRGTPILDLKPYDEHFDSPMGLLWERDEGYHPRDTVELQYGSK